MIMKYVFIYKIIRLLDKAAAADKFVLKLDLYLMTFYLSSQCCSIIISSH